MAGSAKGHKAALGFQTHSGWACAILAPGKGSNIEILHRARVMLHDPVIEGTKQPFHTAEPMPFAEAEAYISRCKAATATRALDVVTGLRKIADRRGIRLSGVCVITASGRALPDLRGILASHALIHAAEGEFYREALLDAADALGIKAARLNRKDAAMQVAFLLGCGEQALTKKLGDIGKRIGRPWTLDEKFATLAAWWVLAK